MPVTVALDIGGTFTDLVFYDSKTRTLGHGKSATTPARLIEGIAQTLAKANVGLADVADFVHGSTIAINTVLERKGASTALIVTKGTRDVYAVGRQNRPDAYDIFFRRPRPLVPRRLTFEVDERVTPRGVLRELTDEALADVVAQVKAAGVESVAVALLHSYARPEHEIRVGEALAAELPDLYVTLSHDILRSYREYERTSTTVLNAYVGPKVKTYLDDLSDFLDQRGFAGQLFIMQSNGGAMSPDVARRTPVAMMESGPVGGIAAAADFGRQLNLPNVIAFDMGGTTAKASLVADFQPTITDGYYIGGLASGQPLMLPVVDVIEVGTGGGSIAWVDELGKLHVGPQSAGAVPGPAAYGRGGTEATTTDANLALGRINPDYFCGGEIAADMDAVGTALGALAVRLGIDVAEAARGVVRVANNDMINALKLVSVNRGYDPRDFTLVAFGGGGGMHASALAADLGIRKAVIPRAADVFSAWGMLMSDLRRDTFVTRLIGLNGESAGALAELIDEVTAGALALFLDEGVAAGDVRIACFGRLRYENQEHSVEVPLPDGLIDGGAVARIAAAFHDAYEREYTYRLGAPVELVGVHVVAIADVGKLEPAPLPATGVALGDVRKQSREVDFGPEGRREAHVYDGARLEPGMQLAGPAIVETSGGTIVVHPNDEAEIDAYGNVVLTIGERESW